MREIHIINTYKMVNLPGLRRGGNTLLLSRANTPKKEIFGSKLQDARTSVLTLYDSQHERPSRVTFEEI